jgi:hypothetical protein
MNLRMAHAAGSGKAGYASAASAETIESARKALAWPTRPRSRGALPQATRKPT